LSRTRTSPPHDGNDAVYWEGTISSFLEGHRPVDGGVVMEEAWTIDEAAFNAPRLCHKPPPVTASNRHFIFSPISEFFVIVNGNEKLVLLGESRSLILGIGLG
jgi:hypothetical protein